MGYGKGGVYMTSCMTRGYGKGDTTRGMASLVHP